jgi:BirA family transcriptional regulator, biotin operon repressor / biotin---[acetyl-CoA-carboxylase] ligase
MQIHLLKLETTDSTNSEAADQARRGAPEGLCVMARQQTAGRGRQGRVWISTAHSGLYFSIVLRPTIARHQLPIITLMTGVAVHDTLAKYGVNSDIKWVNDLLVNEKKVAGILSETVETPSGLAVIVGIGINLISQNLPEDIAPTATSIEEVTGQHILADDVVQTLTEHLSNFYADLAESNGPTNILQHWRQRSTYFSGKAVRVTLDRGFVEGITDGLEENGALRLRTAEGSLRIIQAGDVQRLRQVLD